MHSLFYRLGHDEEKLLHYWFGGKVHIDYVPRYDWYEIQVWNVDVGYFNCIVPRETSENEDEGNIFNKICEEYLATMRFNQCRMGVL